MASVLTPTPRYFPGEASQRARARGPLNAPGGPRLRPAPGPLGNSRPRAAPINTRIPRNRQRQDFHMDPNTTRSSRQELRHRTEAPRLISLKRLISALQNHVTEPVFWGWGTEGSEREKALDTAVWCCQGRYRNVSLHLTLLHLSSPATAAHHCFSYINKNILGPTSAICFDF